MVKKEVNYIKGKNRPGIPMTPKYVVMHNTANTNPGAGAKAHRNYAQNNDRNASFHWAVDDKLAVAIIPENEIAWHAGDGRTGKGNRHGIAIEMCENGDWDKTYRNTVQLAADRLKAHRLPITALKSHRDFSKKNCPRKLIPIWAKFVADVKKELEGVKNSKPVPTPKPQSATDKVWRNYINGQEVKNLQSELNKQFKKNIKVDGWFGNETINALVNVKSGAKGNLTRIIQRRLRARKYDIGKFGVDGVFGKKTEDAVKRFQGNNKLTVDGIVGKNTWKALFRK